MEPLHLSALVAAGLASTVASLILTPLAGKVARRLGAVSAPRPERWSRRPTPLLGGLAVFLAYLAPLPFVLPWGCRAWGIVAAGACMLAAGFWDDLHSITPQAKLVCQIVGACTLAAAGVGFKMLPAQFMNVVASMFWSVAVLNAVNLMDNMDGLASGVSLISSLFIVLILVRIGNSQEAFVAVALAGALAGFLFYNFSPASIFLGDTGSLSIGATLAGLTLSTSLISGQKLGAISVLLVPALVMAIPILDVVLVTSTRILRGQPVSQGGRDHTSHRLVQLGLSERRAVLLLYAFAIVSGISALAITARRDLPASLMLVAFLWVGFGLFFAYLARLKIGEEKALPAQGTAAMVLGLAFKRRVLEVVMDLGLAFACYCSAYLLRFDFVLLPVYRAQVIASLPWVMAITLVALQRAGLYRDLWEHYSFRDVFRYAQASGAASIAGLIFTVLVTRFDGYPRSVFPLYGLLLFIGVAVTRGAFRLLDATLASSAADRISVLIYDTGDLGEAAFLQITSRRKRFLPVGFLDDDKAKKGLSVHGLPILGSPEDIDEIAKKVRFDCLIVAKPGVPGEVLGRLLSFAKSSAKRLLRFSVRLDDIGELDLQGTGL